MPVATSSVDGYLSHTDWGTFNGKQNALGYTAANDTAVVHLTGTETVTGAKTFSASNTIFQNIGFGGSTPSGWGGGYSVVQNSQGSLAYSSNYLALSNNLYFDGANFRYIANGAIAFFGLSPIHEAKFVFYTAPTGTAGNVATITEVAWVDLNGNASFNGSSLATSHGTPVNALGTVGATATCDFTKSAFNTLTLTSATNCTISFTAPANPCDVTVIVSAPASGTVPTQTWPAAVNGTPAAVSTLGKRTLNRFHYDGSRYWLLASLANQT